VRGQLAGAARAGRRGPRELELQHVCEHGYLWRGGDGARARRDVYAGDDGYADDDEHVGRGGCDGYVWNVWDEEWEWGGAVADCVWCGEDGWGCR
jgi:hypothetical protein